MQIQSIGPYRVIRLLGEGGMGMVYEAIRDDIGARAAVKVLRPEFARNADAASRFFNEARAANMIQHAGVVRIFDYGQLPSGEAYLAMEYLEGESLRARLDREVRLSEVDAMRLARQVASALASAHAKNIVHRDLKPENIMLVADAEAPGGERVKVLDFGIAKLDSMAGGSVRTRTNTVMGTPTYMAPEQCRGIKTIGDRADVYALGVLLFEMLSGRPPFIAEAPGDMIGMHMFQPPPMLDTRLPHCDPSLSRLLHTMLLKDPATRPSMNDVAQTLKALGNLSSEVMPMRILAEQDGGGTGSPSQRRPVPAPPPSQPPLGAAALIPDAVPRSRSDADTAPRANLRNPPPAPASSPPLPSPAAVPPAGDAESTLQSRDPPTIPMRSADLVAALGGSDAAERKAAAPPMPSAAPAPSPSHSGARRVAPGRPARSGEDSTELMTEGRIPALPRVSGELPLPDNVETAPVMRLSELHESQQAYLAGRRRSQSSLLSSVLQAGGWLVDFLQGRKTAARRDRGSLDASSTQEAQRRGALLFGVLAIIGLLLGLMILFAK
ncbi:MAG TPA: serine/threonine-protein kinase [Pseudomonadota bacterium]|nr:serine/threonine-protein kinase [Pseudomonadota bacterium]